MALFEALFSRPRKSHVCWLDTRYRLVLGSDLVREATDKVELIRVRINGVCNIL